jgi:hypothetical protein
MDVLLTKSLPPLDTPAVQAMRSAMETLCKRPLDGEWPEIRLRILSKVPEIADGLRRNLVSVAGEAYAAMLDNSVDEIRRSTRILYHLRPEGGRSHEGLVEGYSYMYWAFGSDVHGKGRGGGILVSKLASLFNVVGGHFEAAEIGYECPCCKAKNAQIYVRSLCAKYEPEWRLQCKTCGHGETHNVLSGLITGTYSRLHCCKCQACSTRQEQAKSELKANMNSYVTDVVLHVAAESERLLEDIHAVAVQGREAPVPLESLSKETLTFIDHWSRAGADDGRSRVFDIWQRINPPSSKWSIPNIPVIEDKTFGIFRELLLSGAIKCGFWRPKDETTQAERFVVVFGEEGSTFNWLREMDGKPPQPLPWDRLVSGFNADSESFSSWFRALERCSIWRCNCSYPLQVEWTLSGENVTKILEAKAKKPKKKTADPAEAAAIELLSHKGT